MIRLPCGVLYRGGDIVLLEKGIILENFIRESFHAEEAEQVGDAHAFATDAGPATAFAFLDADTLEQSGSYSGPGVPQLFGGGKDLGPGGFEQA